MHIVKRLNEEHKDFIITLLPEVHTQIRAGRHRKFCCASFSWGCFLFQVIICTKEVSVGARKNAYNLLVEIGKTFVRFCGNTKGNVHVFLLFCVYVERKGLRRFEILSICLWSRCHRAVFVVGVCGTHRLRHHDHLHSFGANSTSVRV